jgi:hypothetical protein
VCLGPFGRTVRELPRILTLGSSLCLRKRLGEIRSAVSLAVLG